MNPKLSTGFGDWCKGLVMPKEITCHPYNIFSYKKLALLCVLFLLLDLSFWFP